MVHTTPYTVKEWPSGSNIRVDNIHYSNTRQLLTLGCKVDRPEVHRSCNNNQCYKQTIVSVTVALTVGWKQSNKKQIRTKKIYRGPKLGSRALILAHRMNVLETRKLEF